VEISRIVMLSGKKRVTKLFASDENWSSANSASKLRASVYSRNLSATISKQRSTSQLDNIDAADALPASAVLVASMERATFSPGLAASANGFQHL
jgi:hypothetical protein